MIKLPEPYNKLDVSIKETTQYTAIDGTVWSVEQQAMSRNKSIFLKEVINDVEYLVVDTPLLYFDDVAYWYHPQNDLELEAVKLKLYYNSSQKRGDLKVGSWVTGAYIIDECGDKEYVVLTLAYMREHLCDLVGKFNGK